MVQDRGQTEMDWGQTEMDSGAWAAQLVTAAWSQHRACTRHRAWAQHRACTAPRTRAHAVACAISHTFASPCTQVTKLCSAAVLVGSPERLASVWIGPALPLTHLIFKCIRPFLPDSTARKVSTTRSESAPADATVPTHSRPYVLPPSRHRTALTCDAAVAIVQAVKVADPSLIVADPWERGRVDFRPPHGSGDPEP